MKKLISIILVITLALTLSGCGDNKYKYTEPPKDDWSFTVKYGFCSKNGNYTEDYCVEFWTEYDLNEGNTLNGYYTQEEVDEMLLELESNRTQFDNLKWDDDTEFWLVRIVSRTIVDTEFTYLYEIEEVGDEDYIVEFYTNDLFSINELALGVETRDEIFLIDFNNGDVVIPIENGGEIK